MATVTVFRSRAKARPPIRKPLNCSDCRRLKQRCDRAHPCSSCQRRGTICQYDGSPAAVNVEGQDHALRERIKILEAALLEQRQFVAIDQGLPESPTLSSSGTSDQDIANANFFDDSYSTGTGSSMSSIVQGEIGASDIDLSTNSTGPVTYEPEIQSSSSAAQASAHGTSSSQSTSALLFASSASVTSQDLLQLLPSSSICDTLLLKYFSVFSPLFHILHDPSFKMEYGSFLCNMREVDLSWLALLNVLLSLAVTTCEDSDPLLRDLSTGHDLAPTVSHISAHFREIAMRCLAADNFLTNHNLHTLKALILLLYAMGHSGVGGTFPLLGMYISCPGQRVC